MKMLFPLATALCAFLSAGNTLDGCSAALKRDQATELGAVNCVVKTELTLDPPTKPPNSTNYLSI
jgi:hypothetical protein